ncbi:MAG: TldD/PmbA family protein [Armatimonadetes bacterium]|nr:TldD/PmbA family protein [Armatimonadota bacterium]
MDQETARKQLAGVRDEALRRRVDFAEVRYAATQHSGLMLQDGRADRLGAGRRAGMGVRVLCSGAWGFASTESPNESEWLTSLGQAVEMAKVTALRVDEPIVLPDTPASVAEVRTPYEIDPTNVPLERKLAAVRGYEEASGRRAGDSVANLMTGYNDARQLEMVCNTWGSMVSMETVRTLVWHAVTTQNGSIRQRGREIRAGQAGYEMVEATTAEGFSVKAADRALSLLSAAPAPAGRFPALFHPSIAGLLVHEALGHNMEADHVLAGQSILEGKLGTQVATDCINVLDDSTIPGSWGSYAYDSEGVPGRRRVLVENGVLKGFLHSLETAGKMGVEPTGSARADGFANRPIVRMSNTMILPGETSLEDLISDIDLGLLLRAGQWGYVWCEKGQYTCHAGEGVMIRNGQLAEQVRDVSVSGLVLETLANALGVSRDFELNMPGNCGKNGQSMPVNGGGPYIKVREIVVGGQG